VLWERPLSEEREIALAEIRIRLGLSHYHKRYAVKEGWDRIDVNIRAADGHLKAAAAAGLDGLSLLGHELSLDALRARCKYTEGDWAGARELFTKVTNAAEQSLDMEQIAAMTVDQCRVFEIWSYSKCQLGRLGYQTRAADGSGDTTADELRAIARRLKAARMDDAMDHDHRNYFQTSFVSISWVAKWMAGRSTIGNFADIVPTHGERTEEKLQQIMTGLSDLSEDNDRMTPKWRALRFRCLGRAYCLQWFIQHLLYRQGPDTNAGLLEKAYGAIGGAVQLVGGTELKREYVLTHLEMSRIIAICLYGHFLSNGTVAGDLALLAGHHLTLAEGTMQSLARRDQHFVRSILVRIAAYLHLLCTNRGATKPEVVIRLGKALENPNSLVMECFKAMGPPTEALLGTRLDSFHKAHKSMKEELEQSSPSTPGKSIRVRTGP
jgi:hypothetical protein